MQKLADRNICSGCHACFNICPKHCITMEADDEGFLYPHIQEQNCINCGRCNAVCPVLKEYRGQKKGRAFACINNDETIRLNSSSGGIFTMIAEYVIDKGGIVFGASFDDKLNVHHTAVDSKSDLYKLRGAKYLQSSINDTYNEAEQYLKQGKIVLFSGTPCQISGLRSYLNNDYDNLIMQDIICHGVPSPMVWRKFLEYQKNINNCDIDRKTMPSFRLKDRGWKRYSLSFKFINGKEYRETIDKNLYMQAFLGNVCLRQACYDCHSKSLERESDITLGDFWGVEKVVPGMYDNKGTSLVFVNSQKGFRVFNEISKNMKCKEVDIDEAAKYNSSSFKSCSKPKNRYLFMKNVSAHNFDKCVSKYTKDSLKKRTVKKIKILIKGCVNKCLKTKHY